MEADINEEIDEKLRADIQKCIAFCRQYVQYWIEMEENTRNGSADRSVTSFFNIDELKRIAGENKKFEDSSKENNRKLCETGDERIDGMKQYTCLEIYGMLCARDELDKIARPGEDVAGTLLKWIYEMSRTDYVDE